MKLMFASDLHGSAYYGRKMLEIYEKSGASQLIFLGDILYHGPRNDLPREYAPKEVIAMLNPLKNQILSVRGNCDTEVDQMVLEFPILADYGFLMVDGIRIYATHGHIFNENHLPPVQDGDVLIHGHTHLRHTGGRTVFHFGFGGKCGTPDSFIESEEKRIEAYI